MSKQRGLNLRIRATGPLRAGLVEAPLGTRLVEPGSDGVLRVRVRPDHEVIGYGNAAAEVLILAKRRKLVDRGQ